MTKRTIRAIYRDGHFEPFEELDLPDGSEFDIEIAQVDEDSETGNRQSLDTYNLGLTDSQITREDAYENDIIMPDTENAGPIANTERTDKTSFAEAWEALKSATRGNDMTDEEAMDLALEAQRWAREQMHKEGYFDDPRPQSTDSKHFPK